MTTGKESRLRMASFLKGIMVITFDIEKEGYVVFMGRDKFENEDLIKFGLPIDVRIILPKNSFFRFGFM